MDDQKLKIVMILSRIEQTGVTTHALDLTNGLVKEGHEVHLLTGGVTEDKSERVFQFYEEFRNLGVPITEFHTPSGNPIGKVIGFIKFLSQITGSIKKINPQVIHVQSPYLTFVPWLLGKKFLTTLHNTRLTRSFKFKKPTHMIAISEESKEMSQRVFKIPKKDISIVNHGVKDRFKKPSEVLLLQSLKKENHIPKDKLIIGCVGRTTWEKGCDVLIEAVAQLNEVDRKRIHLIFLGGEEGSSQHQWISGEIKKNGIEEIAQVISFQDPKPFYDIFDIFVLSSRMESFPLVPIEAMMSGCAVIRSNTEGANEQTTHLEDGLIFENENVAELSQHINLLVNDEQLRLKLAKNAKSKALNRFTIPVMTKNTISLYRTFKNY